MEKVLEPLAWQTWLAQYPDSHILQSANWGELKAGFGWRPYYLAGDSCGALVLFRTLPMGYKMGYIPKGPVGEDWESIWPALDRLCKRENAIFLRIEPDYWQDDETPQLESLKKYCGNVADTVQPRRTISISLTGNEEDWLMRMKQKTRYNIRLAERKHVRVVNSRDVESFAQLMAVTGDRDGFGVHTADYYRQAFRLFSADDSCRLLLATYEETPLAGVMVFQRGARSWFLFGGSSNSERNRMPAYLIQWEAMRWAAKMGCSEYDLWGAPDYDETELEAQFQNRSDGLWGVYRFKRGFGGKLRRSVGAWDRVYKPGIYRIYQWMMKQRKSMMQ
jgi:peptidoglycan pentaglycine glycine transferase (the first glycine)